MLGLRNSHICFVHRLVNVYTCTVFPGPINLLRILQVHPATSSRWLNPFIFLNYKLGISVIYKMPDDYIEQHSEGANSWGNNLPPVRHVHYRGHRSQSLATRIRDIESGQLDAVVL